MPRNHRHSSVREPADDVSVQEHSQPDHQHEGLALGRMLAQIGVGFAESCSREAEDALCTGMEYGMRLAKEGITMSVLTTSKRGWKHLLGLKAVCTRVPQSAAAPCAAHGALTHMHKLWPHAPS
jgi:hypothetical protein